MVTLEIREFMCRADNFGVLLHDGATGMTAAIDAPDEAAVRAELAKAGYRLTHIFTTHHHGDHVAGNEGLKRETGCMIYGPAKEAATIPGLDVKVKEGDRLTFGSFEVQVIETPGHTKGHVTYYIPDARQPSDNEKRCGVAFVGDTLFSVGCGRVFEGTYAEMWRSLQKIAALPADTLLYCGHEYTQSNVAFALTVEPGNQALQERKREVDAARSAGQPTLPVTLAKELETNPFLRPQSREIRQRLGLPEDTPDERVFEELRRRKDRF
jgi:hydroxyacylglutathione hydrolase